MDDTEYTCSGNWVKGSGGHRIHTRCDKPAKYYWPDDCFAYCETHMPDVDRALPWLIEEGATC